MIDKRLRAEMMFYATTGDYSDAKRYEQFARDCKLDKKAFEIGLVVVNLVQKMQEVGQIAILETASATGLTAFGVKEQLRKVAISNTYTSLDIEPNLLDYAKIHQRGDMFVEGDFESLPLASDTFNIYIMMGAEGYRPKSKFYSEVYRVLKTGGYYVMPQIGPQPRVSAKEADDALLSGLIILRVDDYLIAQKM